MSVNTYTAALREAIEPPPRLQRMAESESASGPDDIREDDLVRYEQAAVESEELVSALDTDSLAERSVLVGAAQTDMVMASSIIGLEAAIESSGSGRELADNRVFISADMAQMLDDLEAIAKGPELGGKTATSSSSGPRLDPAALTASFQKHVDAILTTGDEAIKDLAKTVGWGAVGGQVAGKAADTFGVILTHLPSPKVLLDGLGRLKRLALRFVQAAIDKIAKVIGNDRLEKLVESLKDKLSTEIDNGLVGTMIGKLMAAHTVAPQCSDLVIDARATQERADAAVAAAEAVAEHGAKLAGLSSKATTVISWIPGLWQTPVGVYVAIGIVAAMGGAVWQVQDHLDTTEPIALPDMTEGIQSAVRRSLAR